MPPLETLYLIGLVIGAVTVLHAATRRKSKLPHKQAWVGVGFVLTFIPVIGVLFAGLYWFVQLTRRMSGPPVGQIPRAACQTCGGTNLVARCRNCGSSGGRLDKSGRCSICGAPRSRLCPNNHR